jgi:hypothetical protein
MEKHEEIEKIIEKTLGGSWTMSKKHWRILSCVGKILRFCFQWWGDLGDDIGLGKIPCGVLNSVEKMLKRHWTLNNVKNMLWDTKHHWENIEKMVSLNLC